MRRAGLAILACAVILGGTLRFWNLSSVPPALYCDEAFQGYEAYCLLKTGADSRGVEAPLFFDIFGVGWQEPLYVYLTVAPVAILGRTESAVRAVAASAGTLAIAAVAWLAFALGGWRAAAAAAIFMAVSPWAFHFSRIGFQASLLPLFLAAGGAALLHAFHRRKAPEVIADAGASEGGDLRPNPAWLIAGATMLTSALYTYVAARVLVPLLLVGFAAAHFSGLRRLRLRYLLLPAAVVVLVALPVVRFTFTPQGMERYASVGLAGRYHGSEAVIRFVSNYASYLSPAFLLTHGDPNPRHSVRGYGMLLPYGVGFLLLGVAAALKRRRPADLFSLWWLLLAPLPGAVSADPRHAIRAIGMLPAIYALMGCGAAVLFAREGPFDPRGAKGKTVLVLVAGVCVASACFYLHSYFTQYPIDSAPAWEYGLKQAFEAAEDLAPQHDSIYVTREEDYPYIVYLYYSGFDPEVYQRRRLTGSKFLFDEPVFYKGGLVPGRETPLFILKPNELPASGLSVGRTIRYPDGSPAFLLAW